MTLTMKVDLSLCRLMIKLTTIQCLANNINSLIISISTSHPLPFNSFYEQNPRILKL